MNALQGAPSVLLPLSEESELGDNDFPMLPATNIHGQLVGIEHGGYRFPYRIPIV